MNTLRSFSLFEDFLYRRQEYPDTRPTYTIEVTTREELDTQIIKDLLWNEFGEIPDIDNHGTYYRIEHKLTLGALKRLSDHNYVLNVKGS